MYIYIYTDTLHLYIYIYIYIYNYIHIYIYYMNYVMQLICICSSCVPMIHSECPTLRFVRVVIGRCFDKDDHVLWQFP